jgi:hypothetical protein
LPTVFEGLSQEFFICATPVHVGRIEKINPQVNGLMQGVDGFGFVKRTVKFGHAHATKTNSIDG